MKTATNRTRYLILGLLSEQPMTGYEIKKIVDIRFSYFWSESYGQIYPELKKLESQEVITSLGAVSASGRDSKKYQITQKGLDELSEWLQMPVEKEVVRYELLLKLYFSNHIACDVMLKHIQAFQTNHRQQQALFEEFKKQLEASSHTGNNHQQALMVLSFGRKVWKAYDEWCEEMIHLLDENKKAKGDQHE